MGTSDPQVKGASEVTAYLMASYQYIGWLDTYCSAQRPMLPGYRARLEAVKDRDNGW